MKLSVQYIRKSIIENELLFITNKSINNHDYNKLNMIITLSTGFIPSIEDIRNLIESFEEDEKALEEYEANEFNKIQQSYINRGLGNIY